MATTPNLGLTLLEIGQKDKETTINDNFAKIDGGGTSGGPTSFARYLGDLATDPAPTAAMVGARYFNTTNNVFRTLRNATTWVNG
jgi:hypothetical protein